eukprot:gene5693-7084_t
MSSFYTVVTRDGMWDPEDHLFISINTNTLAVTEINLNVVSSNSSAPEFMAPGLSPFNSNGVAKLFTLNPADDSNSFPSLYQIDASYKKFLVTKFTIGSELIALTVDYDRSIVYVIYNTLGTNYMFSYNILKGTTTQLAISSYSRFSQFYYLEYTPKATYKLLGLGYQPKGYQQFYLGDDAHAEGFKYITPGQPKMPGAFETTTTDGINIYSVVDNRDIYQMNGLTGQYSNLATLDSIITISYIVFSKPGLYGIVQDSSGNLIFGKFGIVTGEQLFVNLINLTSEYDFISVVNGLSYSQVQNYYTIVTRGGMWDPQDQILISINTDTLHVQEMNMNVVSYNTTTPQFIAPALSPFSSNGIASLFTLCQTSDITPFATLFQYDADFKSRVAHNFPSGVEFLSLTVDYDQLLVYVAYAHNGSNYIFTYDIVKQIGATAYLASNINFQIYYFLEYVPKATFKILGLGYQPKGYQQFTVGNTGIVEGFPVVTPAIPKLPGSFEITTTDGINIYSVADYREIYMLNSNYGQLSIPIILPDEQQQQKISISASTTTTDSSIASSSNDNNGVLVSPRSSLSSNHINGSGEHQIKSLESINNGKDDQNIHQNNQQQQQQQQETCKNNSIEEKNIKYKENIDDESIIIQVNNNSDKSQPKPSDINNNNNNNNTNESPQNEISTQIITTIDNRILQDNNNIKIPSFYFPKKKYSSIATGSDSDILKIKKRYETFSINPISGLKQFNSFEDFESIHYVDHCVTEEKFINFWKNKVFGKEPEELLFNILKKSDDSTYLCYDDFFLFSRALLDIHPGLEFLKNTPEFQDRYQETIIVRIFYGVSRYKGKITVNDLKRSNFLKSLTLLDAEPDINKHLEYFSYEHFYVIYCKFWELDTDHDLFVNSNDLLKYGNCSLTCKIVDRIMENTIFTKKEDRERKKISYQDFVWFILSEEDKTSDTSIDYWFKCVDLDSDGIISLYEMEYFYEEQKQRLDYLNLDPPVFKDLLCQILDMIKPSQIERISLIDLKNSKMSGYLFNVLFNITKFLQQESKESFSYDQTMSDWNRFALTEYEKALAEESNQDHEISLEEEYDGDIHFREFYPNDHSDIIITNIDER